jgi:hypothetical protein
VRTVLGLSKTSTSIGWVLVDGDDVSGDPLDHDAFDVTDASAAAPAATARRVRDIATATGYTVDSVHVTTSGNVSSIRDALTDFGFADIVSVSLPEATRAWAMEAGRATASDRTAVCILGRDSASLSVIDTSSGATRATTTTVSRACVNLIEWLDAAFGNNGSRPEVLYLIGPRAKLEALEGPLAAALRIPVIATHDAQLALARGAAFTTANTIVDTAAGKRSRMALIARALGVVAAVGVGSVLTLSAAGAPIPLEGSNFHQRPSPPPPSRAADIPTSAAPAVPPPPPAPEGPVPLPHAEPRTTHAEPYAVAPPTNAATVAPPEQHLPDVQPVEHLPDAGSAVAPGPVAPPPPGPLPPPSETIPSPPQDPGQEVLNPPFDALP